ncbi:odorant-binding protein 1b-like, partial [Mesocricetus auratus]|uniref:Odorant-binding protein 1b-like n=1 Tax=Mesocricetus auratus TaxID=10036 RepID=A0ABM2X2Q2_MESAU
MTKFLLLALALGAVHAHSELDGEWVTTAIAADNVGKIAKQGPLRVHVRKITCHEGCDKMKITFYVNSNGQCSETTVVGYKQEDGNFKTQFEGNNTFKPVIITKEVLAFTNKNVDRDGLETHLIYVVGKGDKLSHENNARIEELAKEQKIPTENIREVLST